MKREESQLAELADEDMMKYAERSACCCMEDEES